MSSELEEKLEHTYSNGLKEFEASYIDLDQDQMFVICDYMTKNSKATNNLTSVELGGNHLSGTDVEPFISQALPLMPKLKELDLRDNRIGPEAWEKLSTTLLQSCPKLEKLDISESYVRDEGARTAATYLTKVKQLNELSLGTNGITPAGMVPLEVGVRRSTTLKNLHLEFNSIGCEGLKTLVKGLAMNTSIETLDISDNGIGDEGAVALAEMLASTSSKCALTHINMSVNTIGSKGAVALANALKSKNCKVRHLDLGCNPIEAEGRQALISNLSTLPNVRSLDLTSTGITEADAKVIATELAKPQCKVFEMQWFNNPDITLETEKLIHDALLVNSEKPETPRLTPRGISSELTNPNRLPIVVCTVAVLGVATYLLVKAKRR